MSQFREKFGEANKFLEIGPTIWLTQKRASFSLGETMRGRPTARPFFESQGFVVLAPQVVMCRGVEFVNYRMERVLAERGAAPDRSGN